jgi:hypothetical protein
MAISLILENLCSDTVTAAVKLSYKDDEKIALSTISATFSVEFPNLPPILRGNAGFTEVCTM